MMVIDLILIIERELHIVVSMGSKKRYIQCYLEMSGETSWCLNGVLKNKQMFTRRSQDRQM